MTQKILLVPALVFVLAASACNRAQAPSNDNGSGNSVESAAAADAVKSAEADMLDAFRAKDAAKLTSYYASDALLAVPGRTVKGSDAIGKANAQDFKDPAFKLDFANERTDVAASGDLAYTSGSFQVTYTDEQTKKVKNESGTYVTVFRKQTDGSWKAVADVATPTGG
jgi:uncharacterized protein (TIGR02246 family)